jgi:mono/diheme cytochrome c family protein
MTQTDMNKRKSFPLKSILTVVLISCFVGVTAFRIDPNAPELLTARHAERVRDSIASVTAFNDVYKVLMSPRCMNCHPAGDVPLQGDDSHLHQMLPKRGKDGHGVFAMKCSNCHQPTNIPGEHTPPGNPKWALPPADMKMVFEGKSARELALQIMDYKQNGHKTKAMLIEHARDTLVKAGWDMGEGRKQPPLSYQEFVAVWDEWINKGGVAPAK